MSTERVNRRGFFDRPFLKLEKGSIRASTFALCSAAIGGGVLTLPYVFCIVGWGLACIMLIISFISGVYSNLILAHLADKHKVRSYD
jgi:amino acid permease